MPVTHAVGRREQVGEFHIGTGEHGQTLFAGHRLPVENTVGQSLPGDGSRQKFAHLHRRNRGVGAKARKGGKG